MNNPSSHFFLILEVILFNPYIFQIKGDISRADAVTLYEEASKRYGKILEFGPGASTIFLAASDNKVASFEHDDKWMTRVKKNIELYNDKILEYPEEGTYQEFDVGITKIKYEEAKQIKDKAIELYEFHLPFLIYIDGLRWTRKHVLDGILSEAEPGTIILYHDCFSEEHQSGFKEIIPRYFRRIKTLNFAYNRSNMLRLEVGEWQTYRKLAG